MKENVAIFHNNNEVSFQYGRVLSKEGNVYVVFSNSGVQRAFKSFGCLIEPEINDTVLISTDNNSQTYILAIISRPNPSSSTISLDGDVKLNAKNGSLSIGAKNEISLSSDRLSVGTIKADVVIEKLNFLGRLFSCNLKSIKVVASSVESTFKRLTQRVMNLFRFSETEDIQTKTSRILADDSLTIQAKNAIHQAEENIVMNAEQIHMG